MKGMDEQRDDGYEEARAEADRAYAEMGLRIEKAAERVANEVADEIGLERGQVVFDTEPLIP